MAVEIVETAHGPELVETVAMPQLDFSTFPNQIFWLALALVAIYLILNRVALPRIGGVLAERAGTISNDIGAAEEMKLKSVEAERAYDKALADARAEAGRIIEGAKAEMRTKLAEATEEADAQIKIRTAESESRIGEVRAGAMESVEQVARETAEAIVAALGGSADRSDVDRAVERQMRRGTP